MWQGCERLSSNSKALSEVAKCSASLSPPPPISLWGVKGGGKEIGVEEDSLARSRIDREVSAQGKYKEVGVLVYIIRNVMKGSYL